MQFFFIDKLSLLLVKIKKKKKSFKSFLFYFLKVIIREGEFELLNIFFTNTKKCHQKLLVEL